VNALANPEVGKYMNEHFTSSYQKVGTFTLAGGQKQGGNVASYFTTPAGSVLHIIAGPVDAQTFLREARWVVETWKLAQLKGDDKSAFKLKTFLRKAHSERLRQDNNVDLRPAMLPNVAATNAASTSGLEYYVKYSRRLDNPGRIHLLLAAYPLIKVDQIYSVVFERLLNQPLSTNPVIQQKG
jgi:hypothetical protein